MQKSSKGEVGSGARGQDELSTQPLVPAWKPNLKNPAKLLKAWAGIILPAITGLLCWFTPLNGNLGRFGYDLLVLLKPPSRPTEAVVIYMDEKSFRELKQSPDNWDRKLHARLLDQLSTDGAKMVVFDIWFSDPGLPEANQQFREAIKQNGRVVLAAIRSSESRPGLSQRSLLKPLPEFLEVAKGWGLAEVVPDTDAVVRRGFSGTDQQPGLAMAAAMSAGLRSQPGFRTRWLNFYGHQGVISSVSYCDVTNQAPGHFRDKVVFVGGRPKVSYVFGHVDEFLTPHGRFGGLAFPGVEILATEYLNLSRHEWLKRLSPWIEFGLIVAAGLLLGWCAERLKLNLALIATGFFGLFLFLLSVASQWGAHVWFAWLPILLVQLPSAFAWRAGSYLIKREPRPELSQFLSQDGKRRIPNIPDHVLLRRIGFGGYGEVWLAQNAIGIFRAVKFIFRDRYPTPAPYEREYRGIEKYMPISLKDPLLVHVLHLSRNDRGGFFFYIMEAADDETYGQQITPTTYFPKNLSSELRRRRRFSVQECVNLGVQLAAGLESIHRKGLIHRDIKPANIIYVDGVPKLADIGLVTDAVTQGQAATYVGTEGYIPPEGPGTPQGDIYSLGKVLYEAAMGRDRRNYPDLPTSLVEGHPSDPNLLRLNEIILRACESNPQNRYQSADALRLDLLQLQVTTPVQL